MSFRDKLSRILRLLNEDPLDYDNDWEKFRTERERIRQQAAADRRKRAGDHAQEQQTDAVTQSGGLAGYMKQSPDWVPPTTSTIIHDIETGDGILLPSVQQRGKDLRLLIPWAIVDMQRPAAGSGNSNELGGVLPFAQFDAENWPTAGDFDWDISRGGTWQPHKDDMNKAVAIQKSDQNHYHMLRGADKQLVDAIVARAAQRWFEDQHDEPVAYDEVHEDW